MAVSDWECCEGYAQNDCSGDADSQVADPTVPVDSPRSQEIGRFELGEASMSVGDGSALRALVIGSSDTSPSQHMAVTSLELSKTFLLRAVPASVPLRCFGRMLRRSTPNSHMKSCMVKRIGVFWSHSWSGKVWHKVLMLYIFHNGIPSMVSGALASLCTLLMPVRWLQHEEVAGLVGLLAGLLGCFFVLLNWPCREHVFLDKACINQNDIELKRQGIMSLGFFIRRSKEMLILWDGAYLTRLWCVFEFAARLHIQAEDPKVGSFRVLPTVLSLCALCAFAGHVSSIVWRNMTDLFLGQKEPNFASTLKESAMISASLFVGVLVIAHPVRSYVLELFHQARKLEHFSLQNAACFCCTHDHTHPETGEALPCDRLLIEDLEAPSRGL